MVYWWMHYAEEVGKNRKGWIAGVSGGGSDRVELPLRSQTASRLVRTDSSDRDAGSRRTLLLEVLEGEVV